MKTVNIKVKAITVVLKPANDDRGVPSMAYIRLDEL